MGECAAELRGVAMGWRYATATLGLLCVASGGWASAPDINGDPHYGSVDLEAAFGDDPRRVDVNAGGYEDASEEVGSECSGYISNSPDYRVYYDAGSLPLIISVDSPADTTLVINGPEGEWHCDDDSGQDMNPSVRFDKPDSGRYDIWVGTYEEGDMQAATLYISELESR